MIGSDQQESLTLYRYATALNNIGVAVMEREVYDEASCILEDAAAVARFLLTDNSGVDQRYRQELLDSLPGTLNQAAQRLAVISTAKQSSSTRKRRRHGQT